LKTNNEPLEKLYQKVTAMCPDTIEPIVIGNSGQQISFTNFWDSEIARNGFVYMSWNAGVARILVPDNLKNYVREMKTGQYCIISQGPWLVPESPSIELLFEDHTSAPFSLQISPAQIDRFNACADRDEDFYVSVWTRGGMKLRMPGKFRKVEDLPSLQPWVQ
jgi:hypothetical protein